MKGVRVCVSPMKGFIIGKTENNKDKMIITSYKCDHIEKKFNKYEKCYTKFISPTADRVVTQSIDIPCGHCVECRLENSRTWANRIMLEAQEWNENWFLTLTYNDANVPLNADGLMSLRSKDFQDFMKRLRDRVAPIQIRFFACGEYGDRSMRPHYHAIVFNLHIPDLEFYSMSRENPLYTSEWLTKIWKHGYVVIGRLDWQSAAYTARYVLKKAKGRTKEYFTDVGLEPEFVRMSRRPGLAYNYYAANSDKVYKHDEIILSTLNGGKIVKPPRYFDILLERDNEMLYSVIKARRKMVAENHKKLLCIQTRLTFDEIMKNRGYNIDQRIKALKREL